MTKKQYRSHKEIQNGSIIKRRFRKGILSFEWMMILSVMVVGLVSGLAVLRDSIVLESAELAGAVGGVNLSYSVATPVRMQCTARYSLPDGTQEETVLPFSDAAGSEFVSSDVSLTMEAGAAP